MEFKSEKGTRISNKRKAVLWLNRAAFAIVFAINVTCAVQFIIWPDSFAGAYELFGVPGQVAVRGMGVTFLMWNATYPLFVFKPDKYRALGGVIIAQQAIGCIGEACILATLDAGHELLASSIMRFIAFDAAGLVIELIAFLLLVNMTKGRP